MSIESALQTFVDKSLADSSTKDEFTFLISTAAAKRIQKDTGMSVDKYIGTIHPDYVRHVKRGHKEAVPLICKIPKLIDCYDTAKKSIVRNRKTGRPEVCIEFEKKIGGHYLKLVKLRVHNDKKLSLKTMFVRNEV